MVRGSWACRLTSYYFTLFLGGQPFDLTPYNSRSMHFVESLPYFFPNLWTLGPKTVTWGLCYPTVSNIVPVLKKPGTIVCVSIIGTLITLVLRIIIIPHSSTRLLMIVLVVKYFHLWMVFPDTIRSTFFQQTNIKLHLFVLGAHLHIESALSN